MFKDYNWNMEIIKLKLDANEPSYRTDNNPEDPYISFSQSSSGYNSNSSDPLLIATVSFKFYYADQKVFLSRYKIRNPLSNKSNPHTYQPKSCEYEF
ncbi:hypothetical protein D3C86_1410750 [compost metagenome]